MSDIKILDEDQTPSVFISVGAMAKVQQYVQQSAKEVGWMGQVEYRDNGKGGKIITLVNPYAVAQEVTPSTTDLDATGKGSIAEWGMSLDKPELIKWWGHSHVNMGVSPSGTDMKTFVEHIENDPDEPFVMTIHNKKGAIYCNTYIGRGLYIEDMTLLINYGNDEITEQVAAELKANVREKTYAQSTKTNGHHTNYGVSPYQSQHTWGRGSGKPSSTPPSKRRNAQSNLMGLRCS
jgi:hypothetical protein